MESLRFPSEMFRFKIFTKMNYMKFLYTGTWGKSELVNLY